MFKQWIQRWPPDYQLMYKIPRRQIWCDSLRSWAREMVWVFIVHKLFADYIHDMVGDPVQMPDDGLGGKAVS